MTTEVQAAAERHLHDRLREENFADVRQALDELRAKAAAQQQVRPATYPGHGHCTGSPPNGPGWAPSPRRLDRTA
ncbi:hypothetical protein ACFWXA_09395 [Streptomyces atroolivaceus]|uniref:hypothetical protein n=1 Tax=Streptomyces atroolivaceus TaxID=66869 RepID=UPI00365533E4